MRQTPATSNVWSKQTFCQKRLSHPPCDPWIQNVNPLGFYNFIAQKLTCHISLGLLAASLQNVFSSLFHQWLAAGNPKWTSLGFCLSTISSDKAFNKCPEEGMYNLLLNSLSPDANKTGSICLIIRDCNDFLVMQLPFTELSLHAVQLFSCQ